MNKLKKFIKALLLIIKQPSLLNNILNANDVNKSIVINKFGLTQGLATIQLTDLFPEFNETVEPFCALDGGSTPIDLALLKALAKTKSNCNYLEIGTWRGESVANIASVAKNCVTINLPDDEMHKMGLAENYINSHRFFSKDLKNVKHIQANSQTFDFNSLNEKFDLVFIDGDHHYESVKKDTESAFSILKNSDSIIVWHDYSNNPDDVRWDVLRGILDGTPINKRNDLYRVSNTLCAIYYVGNVKSRFIVPFETPNDYFVLNIRKG